MNLVNVGKRRVNQSPGVNFTNVLRTALTHADPKSANKLLNLTVFFALLGFVGVKAAHRMLLKLTPRSTKEKGEDRKN